MDDFGSLVAVSIGFAVLIFLVVALNVFAINARTHSACKYEHNTRKCVQIYVPWDSELVGEYDYTNSQQLN